MKKNLFPLCLVLGLILTACNQSESKTNQAQGNSPEPASAKPTVKLSELAVDKDLVCGMPLTDEGIADTTMHEGKVYGFCASECKAEFVKNPSAYLAQQ